MHADELDDGLAIQVAYQRRHLAIVEHRHVEALAPSADIDADGAAVTQRRHGLYLHSHIEPYRSPRRY